ncbi:hypothetical protein BC938DRAFT_479345 [Jimgerdemannia flammicorona]|uniref:Uncharacterized protein n=1 Tax=Jimgerdemannia flammicorona TaxID=994334 RepID=A0A433QL22_9FUNG|nr:hypothetical protein BC938DRAFT_479345 [Jimgerdemannia flammicorona]
MTSPTFFKKLIWPDEPPAKHLRRPMKWKKTTSADSRPRHALTKKLRANASRSKRAKMNHRPNVSVGP